MSSERTIATVSKGLDLDFDIRPGIEMLDAEHAHRALAPHDRHARETVKQFLARLRPVGEVGMRCRLFQVQHIDVLGDRADEALAHRHLGDVNGVLIEAARREQLEHPFFAQQIDGADFARQLFADDLDHLVELGLHIAPRRHHFMKALQDFPCRCGGTGRNQLLGRLSGHVRTLSETIEADQ